jgi:hypothetical protein
MNDTRKPRLRWYQFTLRSLFIVMFLACIGMSWVSVKMQRARRQREAVDAIEKVGGAVFYDYEFDSAGVPTPGVEPSSPKWLRSVLGDDFFANVVSVVLDSTEVTDAGLEHLWGLTQLHTLSLHSTHVTDAGLKHLKGLPQLRQLWLNNTQVTDVGLEYLTGLTQLQQLVLSDTQMTDAGLEHLTGLTQLQNVSLGNTQVTDAGLEHLKGLTRLRYLSLDSTQVTDAGVKRLKQTLPKCKILH